MKLMEEDPLDELERRQLFYELKRRSSWTVWNRILNFFQDWADIYKHSLQIASAKGLEAETSMPEADYVMILEDLAHCDTAVSRLRAGDKRVFQCGPMGEFKKAGNRMIDYSMQLVGRVADREISIQYETTPLWDKFAIATDKLNTAWSECGPGILEPEHMGKPTHKIDIPANDWFRNIRPSLENFPADLPEVPNPIENVLASTGTYLKCSGIWEPVEVPPRGLVSLFHPEPPKGPLPIIGAMAYLHGGTPAPRKVFDYARRQGDRVTWRLLWRDDRYEDGTIPEEEKNYVFRNDFVFRYPDALARESTGGAPEQDHDQLIVIESGQPAPEAGRWLLEGNLEVSVQLDQGEAAPLHEGRKVRWVLSA
jgi:hypothetical protein